MRHAKEPPTQILARLAVAEMLKERKEDLLNDLFAILRGKPETCEVAKEGTAKLIEECGLLHAPGDVGHRRNRQARGSWGKGLPPGW